MTKKSDGPSAMMYVLFAVILGIFYIYKEQNEEIKKYEYVTKQNKLPEWKTKTPVIIPNDLPQKIKVFDSIKSTAPTFPKVHESNLKNYEWLRKQKFENEFNKSAIIKDKTYPYLNNQKKFEAEINKTLQDTSKKFDGSLLKK
tara:strand:+ start:256 stop:684 length:429 start_codon:yes stop_codon:yes gene_type:complete